MRIGRFKLPVAFILTLAFASWIAMPVLRLRAAMGAMHVRASMEPMHATMHHAGGSSHGEHAPSPSKNHCADQDCCCCITASLPPAAPAALPAPAVHQCLQPLVDAGPRRSAPDHFLPFSQPPPQFGTP